MKVIIFIWNFLFGFAMARPLLNFDYYSPDFELESEKQIHYGNELKTPSNGVLSRLKTRINKGKAAFNKYFAKGLNYFGTYLTPGPINTLSNKAVAEESTTPLYSNRIPTTPRRKPQDTSECACDKNTLSEMWAKMNRTADKVLILEETITPLKDKIKVLAETIDELVDIQNVGTSLLLTGNLPAQTNAVEDVRHLLIEKLNLRDLSNSIVQAKYIECGEIAFEVASSIDKLRILKRSRDILSKLPYRIEDPNRRADIDIRFSSEERCSPSSPLKELSNPIGNLNTRVKVQSGVVPV